MHASRASEPLRTGLNFGILRLTFAVTPDKCGEEVCVVYSSDVRRGHGPQGQEVMLCKKARASALESLETALWCERSRIFESRDTAVNTNFASRTTRTRIYSISYDSYTTAQACGYPDTMWVHTARARLCSCISQRGCGCGFSFFLGFLRHYSMPASMDGHGRAMTDAIPIPIS